ncbi:putative HLH transcription factor [Aspergillus coremiiformis]|uniref:Putative HLH transcription factor n=1 Tax=Aspergillus coremiiformis TaxID=138285 RepID=A0A5N6Z5K3_9EURO|nr:putative HLH transcription factor [Aspergillus coremiiformis]
MNMNGSEAPEGRDSPQPGPFGYSFLSPMDTPYEPAPMPPPGPALLDDNESTMLENFFTTMNSNHFTNDFWLQGQPNKSLGATTFDWSDGLPPTFEGSTTSLSQPSLPHRGLDKSGMGISPTHSNSDIFAAASMLYQNGMNGTGLIPPFAHNPFSSFSEVDFNNARMNGRVKNQQPPIPSKPQNSFTSARAPVGYHTSEMLFDVREPISPEQQATAKVRPLHWGSDVSFMDQGYVAPPDQPNVEEQTQELLRHLESLEPQSSAANTRAPSPERIAGGHNARWMGPDATGPLSDLRREYRDSMEDLSQPKKRQRTLVKEEDDENSEGDDLNPRSRRSKSTSYGKNRRMSAETIRKSKLQQGAKPARENLTEEQKRNNHILSEQKRRNLIRQGFDDLCMLVPGLKGGGFSKSAMLTQAADWLEDILHGNEILRAQLADLKAMNGLVMPR